MHPYLVLIWEPEDSASAAAVATTEATIAETRSWQIAYRSTGVTVMHEPPRLPCPGIHRLANNRGLILGALFRRANHTKGARRAVVDFCSSETESIVHSKGRHLVTHYWGSYLAVVQEQETGSYSLLRDPTANLACYRAKWGNITVFFSELQDFVRFIPSLPSVNWPHIAASLLAGSQLSRDCSLSGVEDVPGGELISLSRGTEKRIVIWHPGQFCVRNTLEDEDEAAQELRDTVLDTVETLASQHSSILIRLSGGLDSSIVTTCLGHRETAADVTCLNFYIRANEAEEKEYPLPSGLNTENRAKLRRIIGGADERDFARSVANRCGFRLLERERRVGDFDFRRVWNAPVAPRPSNYIFVLDEDAAETECAAEARATACFTGEAGDTVFYCTLRAIGALDYAFTHPFGQDLLRHVSLTATLSGESVARVLFKVIKHGYLRAGLPPAYMPKDQPHLLRNDVFASISPDYFRHPWVDAAPHLCPGKHNHVVGVSTSVPYYDCVRNRDRIAPSIHPLASQPVVETCLRIPTYVLLANGISRGLARRAFGDLLPSEVVRRTAKGLPMTLWQNLVRRNLQFVRDCLLDGILVKEGFLDRERLDTYLVAEQPYLTVHPQQIMNYVACEVWLTQWGARASRPS